MKNEAEFKSVFKKSVRKHGGYSISLSAPMIPGIPDLYIIMPGYLPVLMEAKWLGSIPREKFKRKLQLTARQADIIRSCHSVTKYSALVLVGFKWLDNIYAVIAHADDPNFESMTNNFRDTCYYCIKIGPHFAVDHMFHGSFIPQLQLQSNKPLENSWTGEAKVASVLA